MVLMLMRARLDPAKLEELAQRDPNPLEEVRRRALEVGGITRHRIFATENEVIVVDEWDRPEDFQEFAQSPQLQQVFGELGLTSPPEIMFARELKLGDEVG